MKEMPFENLTEVSEILAAEYSTVVHNLLLEIHDDETVRELVTESAVALASSSAEVGPALVRRLAANLMNSPLEAVQLGGAVLTPEEKVRWNRCLIADVA